MEAPDTRGIAIRPIRSSDQPLIVRFHQKLSDTSVYLRYFYHFPVQQRTDDQMLRRQCFFDCKSEMTFVAESSNGDEREIVGIASLSRSQCEAEVAALVADSFQGHGIGSALVSRMMEFGRKLGLNRLVAFVLFENRPMQKVLERVGFKFELSEMGGVLEGRLALSKPAVSYASNELKKVA